MKSSLVICGVFSIAFISACSAFSHVNIPFEDNARRVGQYSPQEVPSGAMVASENVPWRLDLNCRNTLPIAAGPLQPRGNCPQNDGNFVAIAISGGGSRSAVFSAQVLFELQRYGILQHVDVISSVSGGSFTAALYALSCDIPPATCPPTVEGPDRTVWREDVVFDLLERNFILRWIGNWFYPENIARFWFTAYDRSDIMAETLSDNLFDNSIAGGEGFRFQDLNPQRPNLVINATDNSSTVAGTCFYEGEIPGGRNFTFTREAFDCLNSNLDDYPIAYAVAASAAFPGVFNYVTLGVYPRPAKDTKETHYVHLFDGGPSDNLGLISIQRIMGQLGIKRDDGIPKWVILIDAYQPSSKDAYDPDPRGFVDYFGDTNALDSVGNLLRSQRREEINSIKLVVRNNFLHFTFDDLNNPRYQRLYVRVLKIGTNMRIGPEDAMCLRRAARILVRAKITAMGKKLAIPFVTPAKASDFECPDRPTPLPLPDASR